ncbi:MAG: GTPase HflX [Acidimicrobiales bacterium]
MAEPLRPRPGDHGADDEPFDGDAFDGDAFDGDAFDDEAFDDDAFDEGPAETHRGGFGEFGGTSGGLIERTFREKIIIVGLQQPAATAEEVEASLDELARLVDTAGADVVERVIQRRQSPDPATFIGKGKVHELRDLSELHDVDTVVFDDDLSPSQQLNLEKILGRTAIDRTAVILDIFAQNASTPEGKAQVMLAMLRYRLPRLRGRGFSLSQQAGGRLGARRGPGETQLEIDRRRIVRRLHRLEVQLADVRRHRENQRKSRSRSRFAHVAVVGYTNAGKSTLVNRLTNAGVLVEDRLFATLDATTRRLQLPGGERVLLTDTVGFIKKLPHGLVEAFKTTLEVVNEADLLVHLVDGAAPDPDGQIAAVRAVLDEIGAGDKPELIVFNKADANPAVAELVRTHAGSLAISAFTGEGIDALLREVGDRLRVMTEVTELSIPFARGDALAVAHREGEVLVETTDEEGSRVRVRLEPAGRARLAEFVVGTVPGGRIEP